jgi:hypothetical protein
MTYQRDPDPQSSRRYSLREHYSLREDGGSITAPILVASALIVFIGYMLLGPALDTGDSQPPATPRVEQPQAVPNTQPTPGPAPQQ